MYSEMDQKGDERIEMHPLTSERLLLAITRVQALFIDEAQPAVVFGVLLEELLMLTNSAYGFIGEVDRTPEGQPFLRTHAITDIAWNAATKALMAEQAPTLVFRNLKTLFGHVMTSGKPVLANDPAHDPRSGGLPPGHPAMHALLGLPFYRGKVMTGMVGIANRPGGYDDDLVTYLEPFLSTCAQLLEGYHHRRLRAETETALRSSEERWQLAVQGSHDGIWDWNIATGAVFCSDRWKAMRGFEVQELTGSLDEWRDGIHPDDCERVLHKVDLYLTKQAPEFCEEYRVRRKDGSYIWVLDRGIALWDDDGVAIRMAGSESDITERKQAEQALLEAHTAVELAMEGISKLDDRGHYLFVNRQYAALLGYRPEELVGQSWEITVHPGDRRAVLAVFEQMLAVGRAEAEIRGLCKDGRTIHKHVVIVKPDQPTGKVAGHYCFARDITERKQQEAFQVAEKQALEMVAKGDRLRDVLTFICHTVETHCTSMRCAIMLVSADEKHLRAVAAPNLPEAYNQAVDGISIGPTVGSCGSAAYFGKPAIVADIATDPLWEHYAPVALAHGLKACWSQPILSPTGTVLGTFAAYYQEPREPQPADLNVVLQASHIVALAVEHAKVIEALSESEARFQAFMTHTPAVTFIKDAAGHHLYINPKFERLFHVSRDEVKEKTVFNFMPEDIATKLHQNDQMVLASGQMLEIEETVPAPDGTVQHWLVIKFPLDMGQRRLLGGVAIDITQRKRAEEDLRRTRFAMDQAVDAVYWIDPQARILYTNEAASAMLGYTANEFLGMTVHDLNPDFPAAVWPGFWAETREKKVMSIETVHLTKDGRRIPIDIRITFLAYDGQEFHCVFVRDISERKRAEDEQSRIRMLLTNVIDTTPDLVFVKDRALRIVLCNRAFVQLAGKEPEELIGRTDLENGWDSEMVHGNPEKGIRGSEQDDREVLNGQIIHNPHDLVRVDGAMRIFDTMKVPLRNEQGTITGVLGIARDVTERTKMEGALNALVRGTGAVVGHEFFPVFVKELAQALHVRCAGVCDLFQDRPGYATVRAMWNGESWMPSFEYALASTPCGEVVREGFASFPSSVQALFPEDADLVTLRAESYMGFLLRSASGEPMGHIFMIDDKPLADAKQVMAIMQIFAARAAAELERIRADDALRASQERFALAVRASNDGIWDWNILTGEQYWSDRHFELFGLEPQVFAPTYDRWISFLHPDDADRVRHATQRHFDAQEPYDLEVRVRMKDGSFRWFHEQGQAMWDSTGRPIRMVGSISDMTDRRLAEDALRAAHAELEQRVLERTAQLELANHSLQDEIVERKRMESKLRLTQYAVDQAADQIFVIGPNGYFLDANEAACHRLGYSKAELLTRSVMDIDPDFPAERWGKFWVEFTRVGQLRLETRHRSKSGEVYSVEVVANYLCHDGQELDYAIVRDITERKRHEAALLESEERFSKAFNESAIGMAIVALDGRWLQVNQALGEIVGYSNEELQASRFQAVTHPDDLDENLRYMQQVLSGALRTYQMEKRYIHKNGSIVWIVVNVSLVRNTDGSPKHFISQVQNISERKRIEDRLQATQYAVDHAADQIFVIGPDGGFLDVNEAACRRLGYSKDELLTMSVMDIDPDYPREVWTQHWVEFRQAGQLRHETRHRSKSGELYPVEVTANYHVHKEQELDYAIVRDLTERRQAEAAIRDSELRYKLLTEATFDGIAIHDQGILLEVNAGLERMFGYESGELVGRSMWDLIAEESRDLVMANIRYGVNGPYEAMGRRKDGSSFPGEVVVRPYWYRGKEVRLVAGRDITERKHLEMERCRHTEDLERQVAERTAQITKLESQRAQAERLAALGRLAAGVAHEINNPIAGIKNAFALVKQAVDPAHPQYEFIGMIDREIERVSSIVRNMYQLYRRESGKKEETVDLRTLIGDIEALFAKQLQQRRLRLVVDAKHGFDRLDAPRSDLLQVLLNLLNNAIDCSHAGGTITMTIRQEAEVIRIALADQGPGISPEILPHIFDPFFTTKTEGEQKGMGLGLSISQSLVAAMGGRIDVHTQLGQGSTFSVLLPGHRVVACMPDQAHTNREVMTHGC